MEAVKGLRISGSHRLRTADFPPAPNGFEVLAKQGLNVPSHRPFVVSGQWF
jgi:hypothetical protein